MPVKYCGSRQAIDGYTGEQVGYLYGSHFVSGNSPEKCPICGLTLNKGAYMEKCKHNWTIYFCNKMSTELPTHEAPLINIPLDQPQSFSVCHKCGTVNYAYKDRLYLATHSESYV